MKKLIGAALLYYAFTQLQKDSFTGITDAKNSGAMAGAAGLVGAWFLFK